MPTESLKHKRVGQWKLLGRIGRGGTSDIYRAIHETTNREAAVKVLLPECCADKKRVKAFQTEYEILQSLKHPAIPKAFATDTVDDRPCIIMALCEGDDLRLYVSEKRKFDRVGCFLSATKTVSYLHSQGWTHGDIKVENFVLGSDGRLRMVDFGNVSRSSGTRSFLRALTKNELHGTPSYLAPELLKGKAPTPASDVYALGCLAYILTAGRPPIYHPDRDTMLRMILSEDAPDLMKLEPSVPKTLANIIHRCIAREREARFEDATELLSMLELFFKKAGNPPPHEISRLIIRRLRANAESVESSASS